MSLTDRTRWVQISKECFVWEQWGILEDAPGCWYLYPKPSTAVYGPYATPALAMRMAQEIQELKPKELSCLW